MKGKLFSLLGLMVGLALIFSSFSSVNAEGLKTISAKALDDHECDATVWHFVITQVQPDVETSAPSSIHVVWANGASADVPRDVNNPAQNVAHYSTSANLDSFVTEATAQIYEAWSGQFNLSHGPCPQPTVTPTTPVEETATPTVTNTPPVEETATPTVTDTPPVEETATPTVTGTPPVEETATPTATVVVTGTPPVEQTATPTEPVEPTSTPKPHDTGSGSNVPWTLLVGGLLVGLSLLGLFWSKK